MLEFPEGLIALWAIPRPKTSKNAKREKTRKNIRSNTPGDKLDVKSKLPPKLSDFQVCRRYKEDADSL